MGHESYKAVYLVSGFLNNKYYTIPALFSISLFMTGLFLAQFWGLVFIIMGVAMFIRRDNVRVIVKLAQDEGMLVFSGFL